MVVIDEGEGFVERSALPRRFVGAMTLPLRVDHMAGFAQEHVGILIRGTLSPVHRILSWPRHALTLAEIADWSFPVRYGRTVRMYRYWKLSWCARGMGRIGKSPRLDANRVPRRAIAHVYQGLGGSLQHGQQIYIIPNGPSSRAMPGALVPPILADAGPARVRRPSIHAVRRAVCM